MEGCGGSAICEHGRRKAYCKEGCGGSAFCEHGREKAKCKECKRDQRMANPAYAAAVAVHRASLDEQSTPSILTAFFDWPAATEDQPSPETRRPELPV